MVTITQKTMTNTFSYAWYCDARSRFKTVTIGFGHGYIRFGDGSQPSPKILFLVVRIKKKIGSTQNHRFQEGGSPLHFAKDHHSTHSHRGSHKETTFKKKQSTQCPHTANPHVVRKCKLNLIYFSVDSLLWIKKIGFCLV